MHAPDEPTEHAEIPITEWNESDQNDQALGPAHLIEAFMPFYVLLGEPVTIVVNEKYDLGAFAEFKIQKTNPLMILLIMERLLSSGKYVGTLLVSDGYISHAISPIRVTQEESYRVYFSDPWGAKSFLETGNNILGINARKESGEEFSINYGEYEQIVVAFGFAELDPPKIFERLDQARASHNDKEETS